MKTLELLSDHKVGFPTVQQTTKAWQLIENKRNWLRGRGFSEYPDRVARCASEAINHAYRGNGIERNLAIQRLMPFIQPYTSIPKWNDSTDDRAVVQTLKLADV